MSSLEPDQPQAQVPVAVEEVREPQGQLMNSTSGAAYELETSGDGEVQVAKGKVQAEWRAFIGAFWRPERHGSLR